MHSFTNEQLGVDLDSSIYTGFMKTGRQTFAAAGLMIDESSDEDAESTGTKSTGE